MTTQAGSGGVSDFQNWATGNLANWKFAQFNLWGDTIPDPYVPATSWDQPYRAVPDNGDGTFGVNSWRLVQSPPGWAAGSGIVMANQPYNPTDYAWPVWRAPAGGEITAANAASMTFTFDVLIDDPETAFEPDGKLRVWFGGQDLVDSIPGAYNEISGIMEVNATLIPAPSALLLVAIGSSFVGWLRRLRSHLSGLNVRNVAAECGWPRTERPPVAGSGIRTASVSGVVYTRTAVTGPVVVTFRSSLPTGPRATACGYGARWAQPVASASCR